MNLPKPSLFSNFSQYSDRIAVIDENKNEYSFRQLQQDAQLLLERFPENRQLVFIKNDNSYQAIVSYIACIIGAHPVLLLSAKNKSNSDSIINNYEPNIVISFAHSETIIDVINPSPILLHEQLALLMTTSGSTGSPKLVKLSTQNIVSNTRAIIEYLSMSEADRAISTLDFNYSYGLSVLNTILDVGGSIVLTRESVASPEFWKTYQDMRVTCFSGVPYHFDLVQENFNPETLFKQTRFITQAGGKLASSKITSLLAKLKGLNTKLFIMYGQTEASPRIAYLPPKFVADYPESIGVAIPGGKLMLWDNKDNEITSNDCEGELVYIGPNVMKGYAENNKNLALFEEIPHLKTGDLAKRMANGLFQITGRVSRFAKPLGVRINLDDVQALLDEHAYISATISFNDNIFIFVEDKNINEADIIKVVSANYQLPEFVIKIAQIDKLPRLENGKLNFKKLIEVASTDAVKHQGLFFKIKTFVQLFMSELSKHAELKHSQFKSVKALFINFFEIDDISTNDTFSSLGGDSLTYVQLSLELENYLVSLPANWSKMTISELEALKEQNI